MKFYTSLLSLHVLLQQVTECHSFSTHLSIPNSKRNIGFTTKNIRRTQSHRLYSASNKSTLQQQEIQESISPTKIRTSFSNRTLYPLPKLVQNGTLQVDDIHSIYYEEYGNKNSTEQKKRVALSLHGGPGAGAFQRHAQFFDPELYQRIILFDQRGCGKSTPKGQVDNNTLKHLVQDIEQLRIHLDIDQFDVVLGGSWGSTLALAYAQTFPDSVGSMVLRGVCLFRPKEINWLFGHDTEFGDCLSNQDGFQGAWKNYKDCVSEGNDEFGNGPREALNEFYNYLLGDDPVSRIIAAKSWFTWEMGVSGRELAFHPELNKTKLDDVIVWNAQEKCWYSGKQEVDEKLVDKFRRWSQRAESNLQSERPHKLRSVVEKRLDSSNQNISISEAEKFIPAQAMLTCFYSVNDEYIMSEFDLLKPENIEKIRHIPCIAVQGAKDIICPPDSALDLVEQWPEMECRIVKEGKHSMYDARILSELIEATDTMVK
ncbi:hypothetical protein CTEN210_04150 [Chaetoceros tenuissimus]|uniref:prolyl aminopeptidase n=1 Tax=Chaetoceros tenuissimus TaxID=426638 RepID=A0AAD3H284_9STRA|nr:hypothetical protein CTEN210_04150 [Chaetoceros tenuissimus]